jgi:hypothetical protein
MPIPAARNTSRGAAIGGSERLAGRANEAEPFVAEAIGLYERKGITVLADRARWKEAALEK